MARNDKTPAQLDSIAKDLMEVSQTVTAMAKVVRDAGMPVVLLHGNSALGRFLPAIIEWADKASADVKAQARSYLAGVPSNAEINKQQSANQKKAAGKKSAAVEPAKKKSK